MKIKRFIKRRFEKPLDNFPVNGGFTGILREIACVGDSLSSGEFEIVKSDGSINYHDMFDYSWGQFLGRICGLKKVYNFSRGGMTAMEYCETFAEEKGFWNTDNKVNAYIIALGVNERHLNLPLGSLSDIDFNDYKKNKETFMGYYGKILLKYKEISPEAKFFFMTMSKDGGNKEYSKNHRELLYELAEKVPNCFVLDFYKYAPCYSKKTFRKNFYLNGHLSPSGYLLTAEMIASYIDYIIRNNPEKFKINGLLNETFYVSKKN